MKKMMLGLVVVVMMLVMVGCGGNEVATNEDEKVVVDTTVESEVETEEVKEVIDGLTGNVIEIEEEKPVEEKTMAVYTKVVRVSPSGDPLGQKETVVFEFAIGDIVTTCDDKYPTGTFKVGDVVKITFGVRDLGGSDFPNTSKKIDWEIVEN